MNLQDFLDAEDYSKQNELHEKIRSNGIDDSVQDAGYYHEDFSLIMKRKEKPQIQKVKDSRTGFTTVDTYYDYISYYNYLRTINKYHTLWDNYGYLDLGLIPIIYPPSVNHTVVVDFYKPKCISAGLHLIELQSTSFFKQQYNGSNDYWITRKEAGELLGADPLKVKSEDVLRKVVSLYNETNRV